MARTVARGGATFMLACAQDIWVFDLDLVLGRKFFRSFNLEAPQSYRTIF